MHKWIQSTNYFHVRLYIFLLKLKWIIESRVSNLAEANIHANYVDLALPGMLPVLNEECLNIAILSSIALNG